MSTLLQDLRYGLRILAKAPGFTAVVVTVLALGIGANTAIFSLIDAVLLQSLPVRAPEELVVLQWTAHSWPHYDSYSSYAACASLAGETACREDQKRQVNPSGCSLSQPFFNQVHSQNQLFSGVTAFADAGRLDM